MSSTRPRPSLLGARVPRVEDDRLLQGYGRYIADVNLPGTLEVAFVRSHLAHGIVRSVDVSAALESDGVLTVVTAGDLEDVNPVPDFPDYVNPVATFPLARGRVRYVGAPVAAVIASDRYLAEDAAELVVVDIEPLPTVLDLDTALSPDSERLFPDWPDNRALEAPVELADVDEAMARLRAVRGHYRIQRHAGVPLECRGTLAEWRDDRLTVWTGSQIPHIARSMLALVLGIPESDIRVIAPDLGGGFGGKAQIYCEDYVVAWLARRLERPVRWIEDRSEHMLTAVHARDVLIDLEAAVHEDGRIEALRGTIVHDLGSGEAFPNGFTPAFVTQGSLTGAYRIARQAVGVVAAVTNKTPTGAFRGFGIPEAVFAMERLVDQIADELGIDRFELRRRNLIRREELPYVTAAGARLDSGSHHEAFELALERTRAAYEEVAHERQGEADMRVGFGVVNYVEGTTPTYFGTTGNWTSHDAATIRIDPDGTITVSVGVGAMGQGLATLVATITAEELGVERDSVRVRVGDTDLCPYGLGGWGSRGAVVAAGAIARAAQPLREKAMAIAADMLETSADDLEAGGQGFYVKGSPATAVTWTEIAQRALVRTSELPEGVEPGLDSIAVYDPPFLQHWPDEEGRMNGAATYTNASHGAVVSVDVRTGAVDVERYIVAHDCGRVVNPLVVEGQVIGGVVQGIGGALLEEFAYDEQGQPLSTTFMDYLLPTATDAPPIDVRELESPAPEMPFGIKGCGEAGVIGPPAVLAQAVEHALAEFGVCNIGFTPLTPAAVRALIQTAVEAR